MKPLLKRSFIFLGLSFFLLPLLAQEREAIRNTRVEAVGEAVYIHYDIQGNPDLKYDVWVEVTDGRGKQLDVRALSGDVGAPVDGGHDKLIIWKAEEDGVALENQIFIQVNANYLKESGNFGFSRTGLMLQSLVLPGLGLTRYSGKPHWIKGLTAYACLGGAIAFNRMAAASYSSYSESTNPTDAANYYDATRQQQAVSTGLAVSAVVIWVADLGWTYLATSDLSARIGAGMDPLTGTPLFNLTLKF